MIWLQWYRPGYYTVITMTTFMFLAWIYSSNLVRSLSASNEQNHWLLIIRNSDSWIKYSTAFFVLYAVLNFIASLQVGEGNSYFNTEIPFYKLRGISGFWMAFFAFAFMVNRTAKKMDN